MKTPFGITDSLIVNFEYARNDMDETYMYIRRQDEIIAKLDGDIAMDLYTILVGNEEWK